MWIINNSLDVLHTLQEKQLSLRLVPGTFQHFIQAQLQHAKLKQQLHELYWIQCSTPEERASSPPIICMLSGRMIGGLIGSTLNFPVGSFASLLSFLSTISTSASEASFPGKLLVYLQALTAHPCWPICHFLHSLEFDFMLTTMKQD